LGGIHRVALVRIGPHINFDFLVWITIRAPFFLHFTVGLIEVDFTFKAHLSVYELGDLSETTELVELVFEHFIVQLQLIYVFIEGQNVVVRPN